MRDATPTYEEARQLVLTEVKKFFKPEFLNRLDDIIVFHYLEAEQVRRIAEMFLDELTARLGSRGIRLEAVNPKVLDKLAQDGFDPVYGARPLRREVERQVENPLAMKIVRGECPQGARVRVFLDRGSVAFDVATTPSR